MRLSVSGARLIAAFEGCVLHPYDDAVGNATIGVGHLIHYGRVTSADRSRYRSFTLADAYRVLREDAAHAAAAVREHVHVKLTQNEFDALVSLVFNCGAGPLVGTVGRLLNAGNRRGAADAMLAWDHAGGSVLAGLLRRRQAERALFLAGSPRHRDSLWFMRPDERAWCHEYDKLAKHRQRPVRRAWLRARMTARRKGIWRAAQTSGWSKLHRHARYRSLRHRTGK